MNGRVHGTGCKHGRVGAAAAFESRTDHVHGPYAVCTRAWTAVYTGHKQVHVHGTRPRTRAVNTAVSIDSTRPFTGRVLYTGRKHGRVQGTRPCTRPCSGHGPTMHGHVHGTYTAVHTGRKDGRVPCTAMYTVCTRSGTGRVPGRVLPRTGCVHGPCTWSVRDRVHGRVYGRVDGRVYGPCARHCTYRVNGRSRRVRIVYTGVQGRCTWCVHGHVQGTPTRSVLCTRPCLRPVYTAAHGRVQTLYTAVHGPRTWSVRDPITPCTRPVHGRVRPCTVNAPSLRPVCTALYVPSTEFMQCQSLRQIVPNINHPQYS